MAGVKWKLSSRHPVYDVCNVYADADFGLGKGIVPKNKVPIIPVHPHCLCNLLEVYEGELDPNARFSWDKGWQYIDKLPEKEQKTLFSKEKLAKYRSGGDWRKLAGNWQGEEFRQSRLMNTVENGIIIKRDKLIRGTYALDNNLIQDILDNELSSINMSAEPVYNSRIASHGRTIMSYLYGRVKAKKWKSVNSGMAIGKL